MQFLLLYATDVKIKTEKWKTFINVTSDVRIANNIKNDL